MTKFRMRGRVTARCGCCIFLQAGFGRRILTPLDKKRPKICLSGKILEVPCPKCCGTVHVKRRHELSIDIVAHFPMLKFTGTNMVPQVRMRVGQVIRAGAKPMVILMQ